MTTSRSRLRALAGPLRLGLQVGAVALGVHLLLPQLAGLEATGRALAQATWWSGMAVVGLEAAAFASYAELLRTVLDRLGSALPRRSLQRTVLAAHALGRTLPGGTTAAYAATVDALTRAGADPLRATAALATGGALSSLVLALLLPAATLLAVLGGHRAGYAVGAAWAALGVVIALAAAGPLLVSAAGRRAVAGSAAGLVRALARGPLRRRLDPVAVARTVERGLSRVAGLFTDRETVRRAAGWAIANWLLDLAALAIVALVVGPGVPLTALPLAYLAAQLATALPTTPGGVGVVETVMTATLVGTGAPGGAATATVLGWRLVSHWLPLGAGLVVLPTTLRVRWRAR